MAAGERAAGLRVAGAADVFVWVFRRGVNRLEVIKNCHGQVWDAAKSTIVCDEQGAAVDEGGGGVDRVWCAQAGDLGAKASCFAENISGNRLKREIGLLPQTLKILDEGKVSIADWYDLCLK